MGAFCRWRADFIATSRNTFHRELKNTSHIVKQNRSSWPMRNTSRYWKSWFAKTSGERSAFSQPDHIWDYQVILRGWTWSQLGVGWHVMGMRSVWVSCLLASLSAHTLWSLLSNERSQMTYSGDRVLEFNLIGDRGYMANIQVTLYSPNLGFPYFNFWYLCFAGSQHCVKSACWS